MKPKECCIYRKRWNQTLFRKYCKFREVSSSMDSTNWSLVQQHPCLHSQCHVRVRWFACQECQLVIIGEILAISVPSQSAPDFQIEFLAECKVDAMSFAVFQQLAPTALVDRVVLNGTKRLNCKQPAVCHAVCRQHLALGRLWSAKAASLLPLPAPMSTIWCKCSVKTGCENMIDVEIERLQRTFYKANSSHFWGVDSWRSLRDLSPTSSTK